MTPLEPLVAASPLAEEMESLGWQMTWLGIGVFLLVMVLLVWGAFRRPEPPDEERVTRRWMMGGGVVLPVLLVTAVFVLTLFAMRATSLETEPGTLTVEVTGHQWWWEVAYPGEGFVTANEVHIPAGQPVALLLTSADVIHSFWIPELGGKIDMLPEDINQFVIQADETGTYDGACAEFCGLQHARMRFVAVAGTEEEFRAWAEHEATNALPPSTDLARRGQEVFADQECGDCHTVRGTPADGRQAPDLTHLASRLTLAAGTLDNTTENLRAWIRDPHRFKEGVEMPAFGDLPDDDMEALIAYLEGLE